MTAAAGGRVLILGGTAEARALARLLTGAGVRVISSLAGRVQDPALPAGEVRIGGFGGSAGLADYLADQGIDTVVDATHPFAATISAHAEEAAGATGVRLLRLARPGWRDHPDAGRWIWVSDADAARAAADAYARPFLTTGRQTLGAFTGWADREVLVRLVEPAEPPLPARWTVLLSRGPYDYPAERELLHRHRIGVLLSKDSGGTHTVAKLDAAADLGIPVVIIARPPAGRAPSVATTADAYAWVLAGSGTIDP